MANIFETIKKGATNLGDAISKLVTGKTQAENVTASKQALQNKAPTETTTAGTPKPTTQTITSQKTPVNQQFEYATDGSLKVSNKQEAQKFVDTAVTPKEYVANKAKEVATQNENNINTKLQDVNYRNDFIGYTDSQGNYKSTQEMNNLIDTNKKTISGIDASVSALNEQYKRGEIDEANYNAQLDSYQKQYDEAVKNINSLGDYKSTIADHSQEIRDNSVRMNQIHREIQSNARSYPMEQLEAMKNEYKQLADRNKYLEDLANDQEMYQYTQAYKDALASGDERRASQLESMLSSANDTFLERRLKSFGTTLASLVSAPAEAFTYVTDFALENYGNSLKQGAEKRYNAGLISMEQYNDFLATAEQYIDFNAKNPATDIPLLGDLAGQARQFADLVNDSRQAIYFGEEGVQKFLGEAIDQTINFTTQALMLGETGSLLMMSTQSANDVMNADLEKGYDINTAMAHGIARGGLSYMTEKIGMDNFVNAVSGRLGNMAYGAGVSYILNSVVKQGTAEGLEEVAEWFWSPIVDAISTGGKEFQDENGNFDWQSFGQAYDLSDAMQSFAVAFVSAGMTGVVGGTMGAYNQYYNITDKGGYVQLKEIANELQNRIDSKKFTPEETGTMMYELNKINKALYNFEGNNPMAMLVDTQADLNARQEVQKFFADMETKLVEGFTPDFKTALDESVSLTEMQETIDSITDGMLRQHGILIEGGSDEYLSMSPEQRSSIIDQVQSAKDHDIYYSTYLTKKDGKSVNGMFLKEDTNVNGINIKKGSIIVNPESKALTSFTFGHEATHSVANTKEYAKLRELALNNFVGAKAGAKLTAEQNAQIANEVVRRQNLYKGVGQSLSVAEAMEEIVADEVGKIAQNSNAIAEMIKYDSSLSFRLFSNLNSMFSQDTAKKVKNSFLKAYRESFKNGFEGTIGENEFKKNDAKMSYAQYENGGRDILKQFIEAKVQNNEMSRADADDLMKQMDFIAQKMKNLMDSGEYENFANWQTTMPVVDDDGRVSVVVSNGDYDLNIDFSTVCKKRKMMDRVLNSMAKKGMLDVATGLSAPQMNKIRQVIRDHDFEVACGLCFVDTKRFRQGKWASQFVEKYNSIIDQLIGLTDLEADTFNYSDTFAVATKNKGITNTLKTASLDQLDQVGLAKVQEIASRNTNEGKIARAILDHPEMRSYINQNDLFASEAFDRIRLENPELEKLINVHGGASKPKSPHAEITYDNQIVLSNGFNEKASREVGGVRVQSFSDFMINMVFDYVQMFAEMEAKGLVGHSYTKVMDYAKLFGMTGMKINLSLIPSATNLSPEAVDELKKTDKAKYNKLLANAGLNLDENFNVIESDPYLYDKESIDSQSAFELREKEGYKENVGTIMVGISHEHIVRLLADPRIDMVIPYHKSGIDRMVAKTNNMALYHDYTLVQNTRGKTESGKWRKLPKNRDFDFYKGTDGYAGMIDSGYDARQVASNYLAWCDANGYDPKFSEFRDNPNYYKLLIDFKAYTTDANGNEILAPQNSIKITDNLPANFDEILSDGLMAYEGETNRQKEEVDSVVNDISKQLSGVKYSVDEDYMDAIKENNLPKIREIVAKQARINGYEPVLRFHQTSAEFNEFNTDNPVAGANDSETPNGIFLKTNDHDIGIGGNIQKMLYIKNDNMLRFKNREEANKWYSNNIDGYAELQNEMNQKMDEYNSRLESIEDQMFNDEVSDERYNELDSQWNEIMEGMRPLENSYRQRLRELLNDYFLNGTSGYRGIELGYDGHRYVDGKRENVHTFVMFNKGDVKSADLITYDNNGNVIPLSERFNDSNNDIRYSLSDNPNAQVGVNFNNDTTIAGNRRVVQSILDGTKTVETRNSRSLDKYIGKRVAIVETGRNKQAMVVGWVDIVDRVDYNSAEDFYNDSNRTLIDENVKKYAFDNNRGVKYGYVLANPTVEENPYPVTEKGIVARDVDRNVQRKVESVENPKTSSSLQENLSVKYSIEVTDNDKINELESGKKIKTYRAFQVIDGGLYSPMNAYGEEKDDRGRAKLGFRSELGKWEQATEAIDVARANFEKGKKSYIRSGEHKGREYAKFDINGGDTKTDGIAYNPYLHSCNYVINDQFTSAYRRNLVVVECEVPASEIGAYWAELAKDPTGWADWKSGNVASQIREQNPSFNRQLFLSRWLKPVRILSNDEVASHYQEYLSGTDAKIPWNVVPAELRRALEDAGVPISYAPVKMGKTTVTFEEKFHEEAYKANNDIKYSLDEDNLKNELVGLGFVNEGLIGRDINRGIKQLNTEFKNGGNFNENTVNQLREDAYKATFEDVGYPYSHTPKDLYNRLRSVKLDRSSLRGDFGGAKEENEFVRRNFGAFRFGKDGISVDKFYNDLASEYNDVLSGEAKTAREQLEEIRDAYQLMKDAENNRYQDVNDGDFEELFNEGFDKAIANHKRYLNDKYGDVVSMDDAYYNTFNPEYIDNELNASEEDFGKNIKPINSFIEDTNFIDFSNFNNNGNSRNRMRSTLDRMSERYPEIFSERLVERAKNGSDLDAFNALRDARETLSVLNNISTKDNEVNRKTIEDDSILQKFGNEEMNKQWKSMVENTWNFYPQFNAEQVSKVFDMVYDDRQFTDGAKKYLRNALSKKKNFNKAQNRVLNDIVDGVISDIKMQLNGFYDADLAGAEGKMGELWESDEYFKAYEKTMATNPVESNVDKVAEARENLQDTTLGRMYQAEVNNTAGGVISDDYVDAMMETLVKDGKLGEVPAKVVEASEPYEDKKTARKRGFERLYTKLIDHDAPIMRLADRTNNPQLKPLTKMAHLFRSVANQVIMDKRIDFDGTKEYKVIGKGLNEIWEAPMKAGYENEFSEYLYHYRNIDSMTLKERFGDAYKDKPVFGRTVTADESREEIERYEKQHPEFKEWAKEIYDYLNLERELAVKEGFWSEEFKQKLEDMYPHYVPIKRDGVNATINEGNRTTSSNKFLKSAKGSSKNMLSAYQAMAGKTTAFYRSVLENRRNVAIAQAIDPSLQVTENGEINIDEDEWTNFESIETDGDMNAKMVFFINGVKCEQSIQEDIYDALSPRQRYEVEDNALAKGVQKFSKIRRNLITGWNPIFSITNGFKDFGDAVFNTKHGFGFYTDYLKAINEVRKNGDYLKLYQAYGGGDAQFTNDQDTSGLGAMKKAVDKIKGLNDTVEMLPRLAEFIGTLDRGGTVEQAILDSADITTDFSRGGDLTKAVDRNGFTFLNASVQGMDKQVRKFNDARKDGAVGLIKYFTKLSVLYGIPLIVMNGLIWKDDDDYDALSDYIKKNYYIVGKYGDGKFLRIPKGRISVAVQNAMTNAYDTVTKQTNAFDAMVDTIVTAYDSVGVANPLANNILAPAYQTIKGETWYGDDLIPSRLEKVRKGDQYDESTDAISIALGQLSKKVADATGSSVFELSPIKLNYLADQYTGVLGDFGLPMITVKASNGINNNFLSGLANPLLDKFTTDAVLKNQNVTDFYTLKDELTAKKNDSDEAKLASKFANKVASEMSDLYKAKREIQLDKTIGNKEKYDAVRDIQKEINALAVKGLMGYDNVDIIGNSAVIDNTVYKKDDDGDWTKVSSNAGVNKLFGLYSEQNADNFEKANAVYSITSLKDDNGKTISNSRALQVRQELMNQGMYEAVMKKIDSGEAKPDDFHLSKTVVGYSDDEFARKYAEIIGGEKTTVATSKKKSGSSSKTTKSKASTPKISVSADKVKESKAVAKSNDSWTYNDAFSKAYSSVFGNRGTRTASSGSASGITCPNCGATVNPTYGRCPNCGAEI